MKLKSNTDIQANLDVTGTGTFGGAIKLGGHEIDKGTSDNHLRIFNETYDFLNPKHIILAVNPDNEKQFAVNVGIGTDAPGERLHLADGNFLFEGASQVGMLFKLANTIDGELPSSPGTFHASAPFVNPIFKIGRIIKGGDGAPQFRWMYQDDSRGEHVVMELDSEGIMSSVRQSGNGQERGSHFEAHAEGHAQPYFRLNSYPYMQLQMGNGYDDATDVNIGRSAANTLSITLGATPTEVATFTPTVTTFTGGNVGIGSNSPAAKLEVNGDTSLRSNYKLYFGQSSTNLGTWKTRMYANGGEHRFNANRFVFNNEGYGSTEYMRITSEGKVGIGTTSPSKRLHVVGDAQIAPGGTGQTLLLGRSNGQPSIKADLDNGGHMIIDSTSNFMSLNHYVSQNVALVAGGGKVGIGTTSPSEKLTVSGNIAVSGTVDGVDISAFKSSYDNHNHDDRYYTETEADSRFINAAGDTMTGNLSMGNNNITDVDIISLGQNTVGTTFGDGVSSVPDHMISQLVGDNDGWRLYGEAPSSNDVKMIFEIVDDLEEGDTWVFRNKRTYGAYTARDEFKITGSGEFYSRGSGYVNTNQRVFADNYHPNADTWTTARTITIGNTGKSVNGSANVSWSLAEIGAQPAGNYLTTSTIFDGDVSGTYNAIVVDNDSHTHSNTTLDMHFGRETQNIDTYDPDSFWATSKATGGLGTYPGNYYNIYNFAGNGSSEGTQLATYYGSNNKTYIRSRSDGGNVWLPWEQVWTSGTDGSGSGLDADLLDGQHASAFAPVAHTHTWANINGETANSVNGWGGLRHQTNDGYIDFGPANSGHAHIYTDRPNFYFNRSLVVNGDSVINTTDIRAGIFYDNDNTGYYLDPASNSRYNTAQGNYLGLGAAANTSGSYRLNMGGSIDMNANNIDYVSQLHFNDNVRFYDEGNDSFLNFKYGDASTGGIVFRNGGGTVKGYIYANDEGFGLLDNDGNWAVLTQTGTNPLELRCDNNVEFQVYNSYTLSPGSSRAPIFYDSNNTGYYVDPASTSLMNRLELDGNLDMRGQIGAWVTSNVMSDAIGWNAAYGVYIGSNVGGTHYLRGNGTFTTGGSTYNLWHSGNDGSGSGLDADLLDGSHRHEVGNREYTKTSFYVDGDENTYYPVLITPRGGFSFNRWSISRRYNWTAPWDPIGTGNHKGGLTFDFYWAGDTAWGGNDKSIRIHQFSEQYTTMVGGIALARTGGMIVWLRGGYAYYELQVDTAQASVSVKLEPWTDGSGITYSPTTDVNEHRSSIWNNYPVRNGDDLYINNEAVATQSYVTSRNYIRSDADDVIDAGVTYTWARTDTAGIVFTNNTYNTQLAMGGWTSANSSNISRIRTSSGNLHMDSASNGAMYLNWYSGGDVKTTSTFQSENSLRAPIFYDSNDTNYYLNPASTSNLNSLNVSTINRNPVVQLSGDVTGSATMTNLGSININAVVNDDSHKHSFIQAGGAGPSTEDLNSIADSVSVGQLSYRGYNSSSTNKPPASDNANGVITVGQHNGNYSAQLAFSSDGNMYWRDNPSTGYGSWRTLWDSGNLINVSQLTNDSGFLTSETDTLDSVADRGRTTNQQLISTNPSGFRVDSGSYARIEIDSNDNWSYVRLQDNGVTTWDIASFNGGSLELRPGGSGSNRTYFDLNGNSFSEGSKRATIFYDLNNTGYYVDPASTSNLNGLTVSGTISGSVSGNASTVSSIKSNTGLLYDKLRAPANIDGLTTNNFRTTLFGAATSGPQISAGRWNTTPTALSGMANYGTMLSWANSDTHGFIATEYTGAGRIRVGGGNGDNINYVHELITNSSTSQTKNGVFQSDTSLRAPIFYDSDDTNYYLDPSSTGTSMKVAGRVGIGTTNALFQLDVHNLGSGIRHYGDSNNQLETFCFQNYQTLVATNGTITNEFGYVGGNFYVQTNDVERLRINASGNVGIGTTSPQQKLHVGGSARFDAINSTTPTLDLLSSGTADPFLRYYDEGNGGAWCAGLDVSDEKYKISFDYDHSSVSSATKLTIATNGNATFTGTVTATNFILSSDERKKTKIKDLPCNNISVNWKSFELKEDEGEYRTGVIAQELEKSHPEFVNTDDEGFKSVKYIDLLIAKIAELENRIKELEK